MTEPEQTPSRLGRPRVVVPLVVVAVIAAAVAGTWQGQRAESDPPPAPGPSALTASPLTPSPSTPPPAVPPPAVPPLATEPAAQPPAQPAAVPVTVAAPAAFPGAPVGTSIPSAGAAAAAMDPFTGMPLGLEDVRWQVERARLEEQLAQSQLNRRRLDREREQLEGPSGLSDYPPGPRSAPGPAPAAPGSAPAVRPAPGFVVAGISADPALPPAGLPERRKRGGPRPQQQDHPRLLGVRQQGQGWCLLTLQGDRLQTVCAGELLAGHRVDAVAVDHYQQDGVTYAIARDAGRLPPAGASRPLALPPGETAGATMAPGGFDPADGPGSRATVFPAWADGGGSLGGTPGAGVLAGTGSPTEGEGTRPGAGLAPAAAPVPAAALAVMASPPRATP